MPFPTFIGVGAPRCGTRWLAECLAEHPQVALPPHEVYYFTTRRVVHSHWGKGAEWYSRLFQDCVRPGVTALGEITPFYLVDDETPGLMHASVPEAKLICCLRDQSERAYSWYRLFLRFNPEIVATDYSFRKFLTYHNEVFGREGFYLKHIEKYLQFYDRKALLILLYDDLMERPTSYIQGVYEFLGVDSSFVPSVLKEKVNPMELRVPRSRMAQRALARLRECGVLRRFKGMKLMTFVEKFTMKSVSRSRLPARHRLDPEMRARMAELYADHNRALGEFLGRDLRHWNQPEETTL